MDKMTLARLPHFPENIISIYDCLPQLLIPDQQKLAKIAKNTSVKHSPFSHVDLTGCFANCLWPQNFASEQFFLSRPVFAGFMRVDYNIKILRAHYNTPVVYCNINIY